jgi:hypothetical protein
METVLFEIGGLSSPISNSNIAASTNSHVAFSRKPRKITENAPDQLNRQGRWRTYPRLSSSPIDLLHQAGASIVAIWLSMRAPGAAVRRVGSNRRRNVLTSHHKSEIDDALQEF